MVGLTQTWLPYLVPLAVGLLGAAFYCVAVPDNPPGFYLDESSIAFNAHAIAATGRDEYGESWPLFFRAFGEYKNPVYIYLLAAVFKITGPSIAAARMISALLGVAAALVLGHLAARISRRQAVGVVVSLSALVTPWLYENSRPVFEVALYPLALALFLLALHRAASKERWSLTDVLSLTATLALLTYSYSIGRLFAPMLALGLAFFATRRRRWGVLQVWLTYGLTIIPAVVFHLRHSGALTSRFAQLTYLTSSTPIEAVRNFVLQYAADFNPVRLLLSGEDNIRDHVAGMGPVLFVTFGLTIGGLILVVRSHRSDPWWRFMLYALAASVVPAALTTTVFPQIRLIGVPVLMHVFTVPAWVWLLQNRRTNVGIAKVGLLTSPRRVALVALLMLTLAQGLYFQWLFHWQSPARGYVFDDLYAQKILAPALGTNRRPLYLYDEPGRSGYIHAYWHGLLSDVDASQFIRLDGDNKAPAGAVVISTEESCTNCRLLVRFINFIIYTTLPSDLHAQVAALPDEGFRAEVVAHDVPDTLRAGERRSLNVMVRNISSASWPSVGNDDGRYEITIRNRWLKNSGKIVDDGRKALHFGLDPRNMVGVSLAITTPETPGSYTLEVDVVQEGVAWFGERGSQPFRKQVIVVP